MRHPISNGIERLEADAFDVEIIGKWRLYLECLDALIGLTERGTVHESPDKKYR